MGFQINQIEYNNLTTVERDALVTPPKGTVIYNSTLGELEVNDGTGVSPVWTKASVANLTKSDVGLGNVQNVDTTTTANIADSLDKRFLTDAQESKLDGVEAGAEANVQSDWNAVSGDAFILNKPDLSLKADLVGGLVPASQLPSYVDDVLEFANLASFPPTGEAGKIYVALDTNKTYRWAATVYVEISDDLSATEIKTLYESNANTNAFTDAEQTKLGGIADGAEVNVNADWNAISGDAEILNKPTDVTDLSAHSVTELNDVTSSGSGVIISSAERTNLSNQSGVNTGDEVQATETVAGIAEIATTAEVTTGTDDLRIVTPLKLKNELATSLSNVPKIITSITGINAKVVGLTNLYTVPTGKKVIVSEIFIEPTSITGLGDGPKISVGTNATAHDNIVAVTDLKTLKIVGDLFGVDTEGLFKRANATEIIKLNNSAIASTTTYVYTAHLIGFEI